MCNHIATPGVKQLTEKFPGYNISEDLDERPHAHIHGYRFKECPIITSAEPTLIQPGTWGFIPQKVEDRGEDGSYKRLLNAREDNLFQFWKDVAHQRCVMLVDGFYDYQHKPNGDKVPYYIYFADKRTFGIGGLWRRSRNHGLIFAMVTTEANAEMLEIHNSKGRMPLVLDESDWAQWLDSSLPAQQVLQLAKPYPDGIIQAHTVKNVLMSRTEDTDCEDTRKPAEYTPQAPSPKRQKRTKDQSGDTAQGSLF